MAQQSGYCLMSLTVSESGYAVDVRADECTESVFCQPSVESVERWIYHPKIHLGDIVERPGVETKISYRLTDHDGTIIPESKDELVPCIGNV